MSTDFLCRTEAVLQETRRKGEAGEAADTMMKSFLFFAFRFRFRFCFLHDYYVSLMLLWYHDGRGNGTTAGSQLEARSRALAETRPKAHLPLISSILAGWLCFVEATAGPKRRQRRRRRRRFAVHDLLANERKSVSSCLAQDGVIVTEYYFGWSTPSFLSCSRVQGTGQGEQKLQPS